MTRSKKAAKAAFPAPVIDPYLPGNGNFGYRVSRYELDLEYKVAINRLSGSATITGFVDSRELAAASPYNLLACSPGACATVSARPCGSMIPMGKDGV